MAVILSIITLILGTLLGLWLQRQPGYIWVLYREWWVELPLWLGALMLIPIAATGALVVNALQVLINWQKHAQGKWQYYQTSKQQSLWQEVWWALEEGSWPEAERLTLQSMKKQGSNFLSALMAGFAAYQQAAYRRAGDYLENSLAARHHILAYQREDLESLLPLIRLIDAEIELSRDHLKILSYWYEALEAWPELQKLLPRIKQFKLFPGNKQKILEERTYGGVLALKAAAGFAALSATWQSLPKLAKSNPYLLERYTSLLIGLDKSDQAAKLLERLIDKDAEPKLFNLYGDLAGGDSKARFKNVEGWLSRYGYQDYILLCAGKLAIRESLWGKARDYLEASLQKNATVEVYAMLGYLLENMGQLKESQEYYKKALQPIMGLR